MTIPTTEALPKGMALVETWNGRWFPAFAPDAENPSWVILVGNTSLIPSALDSLTDSCPGYPSREAAVEAYQAWREEAVRPLAWQALAASREVYPERNAWYLDEIAHLTGDDALLLSLGTYVHVVVMAAWNGRKETIDATGDTPDEAIEALYERVYARYCQQQQAGARAG